MANCKFKTGDKVIINSDIWTCIGFTKTKDELATIYKYKGCFKVEIFETDGHPLVYGEKIRSCCNGL